MTETAYTHYTLQIDTVLRIDRGDGTIEERRVVNETPAITSEGATLRAELPALELHVHDLISADETIVPKRLLREAQEMARVASQVVPYVTELEAKYRAAVRTLGEQPALSMELSADTIAQLAAALAPVVNVAPAEVNIVNEVVQPPREITVKRDPKTGLIESASVEDA